MPVNSSPAFFTRELLYWNKNFNDRTMPWKGEKDPYKIWLSEIILQQTRVDQGLDYYHRFLNKYPTVKALAAAADQDVFKLWEGLGYYARCRNLLATARHISEKLNGEFPVTYDGLLSLKGIGPYTAAAIGSFAFNLPTAVVDGNVLRVLSRYFGIDTPIDGTAGKKIYNKLARDLLAEDAPALYNQSIMDFGATICKPQLPLCAHCILQKQCSAWLTGNVSHLPVKEKKLTRKERWFYYFVISSNDGFYIRQRIQKDIWQNLHEFLLIELPGEIKLGKLLQHPDVLHIGIDPEQQLTLSDEYRQLLTHQVIHARFIPVDISHPLIIEGFEFVQKKAAAGLAFPRVINHYLTEHVYLKADE